MFISIKDNIITLNSITNINTTKTDLLKKLKEIKSENQEIFEF